MQFWFGGSKGAGGKTAKEDAIKSLFPTSRSEGQSSPLHGACKNADVDQVRKILKCKKTSENCLQVRDCCGNTPMYYAVEANSTEIVQLLLEKSPKLFKDRTRNEDQVYSSIMLQMAIEKLNLDIIEVLLKSGCPVNIKTKANAMAYDWTPLQFTCSFICVNTKECGKSTRNHPVLKIVNKLLKYKADPMIKDDLGRTALDILFDEHSQMDKLLYDIALLLLKNGVDSHCNTDNQKKSLLYLAVQKGRAEIVQKLVQDHNISIFEVSPS